MRRLHPLLALMLLNAMSIHSLEATIEPALGVTEAVVVSQDTRFDPKLQLQVSGEAGLSFVIGPVSLGPYIGLHSTGASNLEGGYLYRGYRGWHWGARLSTRIGRIEMGSDLLMTIGMRAAASARFSTFHYTQLLFFYPHVGIAPYLDFHRREGLLSARFSMPVDVYLRRDLRYSVSAGLGIEVALDMVRIATRIAQRAEGTHEYRR